MAGLAGCAVLQVCETIFKKFSRKEQVKRGDFAKNGKIKAPAAVVAGAFILERAMGHEPAASSDTWISLTSPQIMR